MIPATRAFSLLARRGQARINPWDEFERLLSPHSPLFDDSVAWPRVDIVEKPEQFEVHMDLPGVAESDVDVKVDDGRVEISGKRTHEIREEDAEKHLRRVERRFGSFKRTFALPDSVEEEQIKAHLENGVLQLTLPKRPEKRQLESRSVPISKK